MNADQFDDTYDLVGEIFQIFEDAKAMFSEWDASKHMPFIQKFMKLKVVEDKLYQLGYDETFVGSLVKTVYESVFTIADRRQFAGNWHIIV